MARVKGLHVHPIKDGVFSFITKGFANDEQILGKTCYRYTKARYIDGPYRSLHTADIEQGVYLVLKNTDIFGIYPTYSIMEHDEKGNIINVYNIYKQK